MRFKAEIVLLLLALILYIVGAFCYYYEAPWQDMLPVINYPYRDYTFPLIIIASALLVIAAILYLKRK